MRFPAESHELTRSGSPLHRVLALRAGRRVVRPLPQGMRGAALAALLLLGDRGARLLAAGAAAGGRLGAAAGALGARLGGHPLGPAGGGARRRRPGRRVPGRPARAGSPGSASPRSAGWSAGSRRRRSTAPRSTCSARRAPGRSVAVAGQPTPRNRWGYPGWVPTRQLTDGRAGRRRADTAVLRRPTAWLYESAALEGRVLELSYGTRLPVLSVTATPSRSRVRTARPAGCAAPRWRCTTTAPRGRS